MLGLCNPLRSGLMCQSMISLFYLQTVFLRRSVDLACCALCFQTESAGTTLTLFADDLCLYESDRNHVIKIIYCGYINSYMLGNPYPGLH